MGSTIDSARSKLVSIKTNNNKTTQNKNVTEKITIKNVKDQLSLIIACWIRQSNVHCSVLTNIIIKFIYQPIFDLTVPSRSADYDFLFKCVMFSEHAGPNGKSSILKRWVHNEFNPSYDITIGVEFETKNVCVCDDFGYKWNVKLQVWDVASCDPFRSIRSMATYLHGAYGILLVYDVSNRKSFNKAIAETYNICRCTSTDAKVILIGNKCDLEHEIDITTAQNIAYEYGIETVMEVSAKTSYNIEKVFDTLSKQMLSHQQKECPFLDSIDE